MKQLFIVLVTTALTFIALMASTLFGALGGWLVDRVLDGAIAQTLTVYGLPYVELWKVGGTLGFLSTSLPKLFRAT